eukprot:s2095_g5.t1
MRLEPPLSALMSAGSLTTYPLSAIGATTLGSSPPLRLHRFTWALEGGGGVEQGRLVDLKVQCPSSELQNLVPRWYHDRVFAHLGLAVFSFSVAKLESSMLAFDSCSLGFSLSARSFVQPGSGLAVYGGATLNVGTPNINSLQFDTNSYIKYSEGANDYIQMWVGGFMALDMEFGGTASVLHGAWDIATVAISSDRRLKTEIRPLRRTLQGMQPQGENATGQKKKGDGALWMLRQLRPVSYSFKAGSESKYMRFGFIADELETTVPQVVRSGGTKQGVENSKTVQMFDLIALLTAAGQSQQEVIENQERLMDQVESEFEAFKAELKLLKELKEKKRQANRALACGATRKKRRRLWWR